MFVYIAIIIYTYIVEFYYARGSMALDRSEKKHSFGKLEALLRSGGLKSKRIAKVYVWRVRLDMHCVVCVVHLI